MQHRHLGVLSALGDHGDLLQHLGIGGEEYEQGVLCCGRGQAGGLVTHIRDRERVGGGDGEREEPVEVGGGTGGSAAYQHGCTDERFAAVGVEDKTCERTSGGVVGSGLREEREAGEAATENN